MHRSPRLASLLIVAAVASATSSTFAQQLGTAFLDFDGENGTPQGDVTALNASIFPQAVGSTFTTAELKTAILDVVRQNYLSLSISIIDDTIPLPGTFTRVVVGNNGTAFTNILGVASELDFRNKRQPPVGGSVNNTVSILANPHKVFGPGAGGTFTLAQAARFVGNTTSHEIGHVLGLVHSDVVSTFRSSGGGFAGQASVRASEIMQAQGDTTSIFSIRSFGGYSRTKLDISTGGINVQPEVGAAVDTAAGAADPARAGDTPNAIAGATTLTFDTKNRVTALGSLGAADTADLFKFTGTAGQVVTAEVFSTNLSTVSGAMQGRIADPVNTLLELVDGAGALVPGYVLYDQTTNFDGVGDMGGGDFGSEQLIFKAMLPTAGTYGVRVSASGADTSGNYELLVLAPEPVSIAMLVPLAGILVRRRRA